MNLDLDGKVAIVTGGSRGIGKAIARQLAIEGVDVGIAARDQARLDAATVELGAETGRLVVGHPCDTTDDESVRAMVDALAGALGSVDILVNCAAKVGGLTAPPKLADLTTDELWSEINTKVMGYLRCAREVAPRMIENGWGRIINVSGLAARQSGSTLGSIRNVSVAAMTKNLADELGPQGINVTVVHPGLTRTEATPGVIARMAAAQGMTESDAEANLGRNAIRRIVDASEVADVVAFLASPRSSSITGDAIACGGGTPGAIYY